MWLIHGTKHRKDMEACFTYESHPLKCSWHLESKLINPGLTTFKVTDTHCNKGCDHNLLFVCQYPHHCVPLLLTHLFDNAIDKVNTTANKLTLWYILHLRYFQSTPHQIIDSIMPTHRQNCERWHKIAHRKLYEFSSSIHSKNFFLIIK